MDYHRLGSSNQSINPTQILDHLSESNKKNPNPFPLSSFELLNKYGSGLKRFSEEKLNELNFDSSCNPTSDLYGFEENEDVEILQLLLASAKKIEIRQFELANKLLNQCHILSSDTGNPVQRFVYYFAKALQEKIDRDTSNYYVKKPSLDIEQATMSLRNSTVIVGHKSMPFCQISHFTGVQAILECVSEAKKVHIIVFMIRNGVQCTALMQGLANRKECPEISLLRITAVGTKSKSKIEETGKQLESFAHTLNLPLSFRAVIVEDLFDLREEHFTIEAEEKVAIYASLFMNTMIWEPNKLQHFMGVIKNINPCVMVVTEVEADHNSNNFWESFLDAFSYYSAFFDCLDSCMDRNDPSRIVMESVFVDHGIRNIVAAGEEERTVRHMKINNWREFFQKLGMREMELSDSTLCQASLVVKKFNCGNLCTFCMDGKCLIMGWKGTPMYSLSTWKFL